MDAVESNLGFISHPRKFGMKTGATRGQITNLLISKRPATPTPRPVSGHSGLSFVYAVMTATVQ